MSQDGRNWRFAIEMGIAFERYRGESDPPPDLFVFNNKLWQWSTEP